MNTTPVNYYKHQCKTLLKDNQKWAYSHVRSVVSRPHQGYQFQPRVRYVARIQPPSIGWQWAGF